MHRDDRCSSVLCCVESCISQQLKVHWQTESACLGPNCCQFFWQSQWPNYCIRNHMTLLSTAQKLQQVQNNAAKIMLHVSRRSCDKPLLQQLHWLPVQQWITYKLAVLTYKDRSTSTLVYTHHRIAERACSRTLRSSAIPLLDQPFMRTDFSRHAFRFSASSVWNSLPQTVLISDALSVFKSSHITLFV